MSLMCQAKKLQSYRGGQSCYKKKGGGTILCFQHADVLKTSVVSKIQINWTNIDQVMALCANWHS